ncbi:MAG: HNH endonuclease [Proteobacteria bacterium]|nr:MAG: HNH endonuclease [Pseudomonadota bacterium]
MKFESDICASIDRSANANSKIKKVESEISEELIAKIRSLPKNEFEASFKAHLRTERKISMIIVYFMQESYRRRTWAQNFPSSTVAKMSHFFHRESKTTGQKVSPEKKREVFEQMQGLTLRQVERELAIRSPQSALPDKTRQITETAFVRQFTTNQDLENKITRAKQLLMHTLPQPPSDCQLFTKITDLALEKIDPILKQKRMDQRAQREADRAGDLNQKGKVSPASARAETQEQRANLTDESNISVPSGKSTGAKSTGAKSTGAKSTGGKSTGGKSTGGKSTGGNSSAAKSAAFPSRTRTHIPESLKREVLQRDDYACSHVNYDTGKICSSQDAIELDHILPVAQGGENTLENLRVLCRTHNQLRALETYGRKKMGEHISSM